MPAQKVSRPVTRSQLVPATLNDNPVISRLLGDTADELSRLTSKMPVRAQIVTDLVVGINRVNHGLGRRASGATLGPTSADASFAWAFSVDNDTQILITIIGVDQLSAALEVW